MNLQGVLHDLVDCLEADTDCALRWEQVREWPDGAVRVFQQAGWIRASTAASEVVCPGCERACYMPVHTRPTQEGQTTKAFVACDKSENMGLITVPPRLLQQWQVSLVRIAAWIAASLGLRLRPKHDRGSGIIWLGKMQGRKRLSEILVTTSAPISMAASGHSLPLEQVVDVSDGKPVIDRAAILDLVDRPPPEKIGRYQPSTNKRDARKLGTQEMYESWRKALRQLRQRRPNMSNVWYSQQIAKMDIARNRSAETIRKNMKL